VQLARLRGAAGEVPFAVRSSALAEDSARASFAGEFETMLNVRTEDELQDAIRAVRRSRKSVRVQVYSQAIGMGASHEIAIVVQCMLDSQISGVLFSADPVTGGRDHMTGNFVYGLGDQLVSGSLSAESFTLRRPDGHYTGPPELKYHARKLHKLATRLEKDLGCQPPATE
jgi:pyruvate,water dikinase